jgi:hypothetical protein
MVFTRAVGLEPELEEVVEEQGAAGEVEEPHQDSITDDTVAVKAEPQEDGVADADMATAQVGIGQVPAETAVVKLEVDEAGRADILVEQPKARELDTGVAEAAQVGPTTENNDEMAEVAADDEVIVKDEMVDIPF